jgi:hypothetical protein
MLAADLQAKMAFHPVVADGQRIAAMDWEREAVARGAKAVTIALVKSEGTMRLREMTSEPDGALLATIPRTDAGPGGDMVFALEIDGRRLATAYLQQP